MTRVVLVLVLCCAGCSAPRSGIIRGYVVDVHGQRAPQAHVTASHLPPTDQHPPQLAKTLAETTADSHGNFTVFVDQITRYTLLIASFDNQSGVAAPSFDHAVRIPLRRNRPRVVP